MKMKCEKKTWPPVNIGTSFMLVLFMILCLVVFSVLSFSSAWKDYQYSLETSVHTQEYYHASNQAEEKLEQIDRILSSYSSIDRCIQELEKLDSIIVADVSSETCEYSLRIDYQIPINPTSVLCVSLSNEPYENHFYTILSWTQQSVAQWNGNQSLPVLGRDSQ